MARILLLAISILCLLSINTHAQEQPQTVLTVANGLPQSFVSSLVQDKTGFIWIGTRDGLARYDGRKFKNFGHIPGDSTTLASSVITNLYLDSRQQLWICYDQGAIDVLNTATEALYHFTEDAAYSPIAGKFAAGHAITEDAQGQIWIRANQGTGFFICNMQRRHLSYMPAQALCCSRVLAMAVRQGTCYFTGDTAMVVMPASSKLSVIPYTFGNPQLLPTKRPWKDLTPVVRNRSAELVAIDEERLLIYNSRSQQFTAIPLPHRELYMMPCITQDDSGTIFLGYNRSIYQLNKNNELSLWRAGDSLYLEPICMMYDRSGMLWTGSNATGLQGYDLRLSRISSYSYKDGFLNNLFLSVLKVPEAIYKKTFLFQTRPYLFRWAKDSKGNYWLSNAANDLTETPQLLQLQNGQLINPTWRYVNGSQEEHKRVSSVATTASGQIWGVDHDFRLVHFNADTKWVTIKPPILTDSPNIKNAIMGMVMDGEDTCWIATTHYGLIRYIISSKNLNQFTHYKEQAFSEFTSVTEDKINPGYLWLGSLSGGLMRFDKRTQQCLTITTREGLPNNTVYAVVQDQAGLLWCSSNRGVFSFSPATLTVTNTQDLKDALSGEEFNRAHFFQTPDNRILFGGIKGYVFFDPAKISSDNFSPQVAITGLSIDNDAANKAQPFFHQAINSLDAITLPYNKNFLSFDFAALEFNMPDKIRYRYMLEGLDENWIEAGTRNSATYTNIPPGSYRLKIEATNAAGVWSNNVKQLKLIIEPPFWKTWWFIGCWLAVLTAVLLFFIRWRIHAIREKAQTRLRHERDVLELEAQALRAQMNPHFIFNCLNSIKALIQEEDNRQAAHYLTGFSRLIRNQLNNARREITLYEELESCRLYLEMESLRFRGRVHCTIHTDEDIDTHSVQVPSLIIQPFIENAIWHGVLPKEEDGTITVSVKKERDQIVCIIEDDGIGRATAAQRKSHTSPHQSKGMQLVANRLQLHDMLYHSGGTLTIIDKTDAAGNATGTIVRLCFKQPEND